MAFQPGTLANPTVVADASSYEVAYLVDIDVGEVAEDVRDAHCAEDEAHVVFGLMTERAETKSLLFYGSNVCTTSTFRRPFGTLARRTARLLCRPSSDRHEV